MASGNAPNENENTGSQKAWLPIAIAVISATATVVVGYWQFYPKDQPRNKDFVGRVLDAKTEEKLRGAKVSLEADGVPPVIYTDSEGVFTFPIKNFDESIRIRVEVDGYGKFDRRVKPSSKSDVEDVRLEPLLSESNSSASPLPTLLPSNSPSLSPSSSSSVIKDIQAPFLPLQTGTYSALGTMWNNSRREIINNRDRACIRIIDGSPNNYEGHQTITISSLSWRDSKFYIDAKNVSISLDRENSFYDGLTRAIWELESTNVSPSQEMNECLAAQKSYAKVIYGNYFPGQFKQGE